MLKIFDRLAEGGGVKNGLKTSVIFESTWLKENKSSRRIEATHKSPNNGSKVQTKDNSSTTINNKNILKQMEEPDSRETALLLKVTTKIYN